MTRSDVWLDADRVWDSWRHQSFDRTVVYGFTTSAQPLRGEVATTSSTRVRRRSSTMKITTVTSVSVDGVAQGLGGSNEDRRASFERGGWALPLFDSEVEHALSEIYQRAEAYLFGRWTYEVFANSWGAVEDMKDSPIGRALNTRRKYLVSATLAQPQWADTTLISGDLTEAIGELKARGSGELQVHGSISLVRWLLEQDLVDEITLFTYPVILGQGQRLFVDAGRDTNLDLAHSKIISNGVSVAAYRPLGRPRYAS